MNFKALISILTLVLGFNLWAAVPTIDLTVNDHVLAGDNNLLDASGSFDPDGDDLAFRWRIVNAPLNSDAQIKDNNDGTAEFVSDRVGPYGFELLVIDSTGEISKKYFSISASQSTGSITYGPVEYDVSVICNLTFGVFGCNTQTYNFSQANPTGSYSLVISTTDIDKIIATLNGEQITFYSNTSGEGQETFVKEVFLQLDNELIVEASGGFSGHVSIQVQENNLMPSTNEAPVISKQILNVPDNTQPVTISLNVTDANSGDFHFFELLESSYNGSTQLTGNTITYTANSDFLGEDEILVRVYDTGIPSKQTLIPIRVLVSNNTPPVLAINNFNGHTEVMSNVLSVMDTDQVTVSISRQGMGGTTSFDSSTNIVTYTPNAGFVGLDSFEILAIDNGNFNLETRYTVSVDVQANTPPTFPDLSIATKPNNAIEFELPVADAVDANQNIVSYELDQNPTNGTVEQVAGVIYRYIPNQDYEGLDTIRFKTTDSGASTNTSLNTVTVDVTPSANIPPVIGPNGITALKFNSGVPAKMYLRLADLPTDPDGTVQKIRWDFGDGNVREFDTSYIGGSAVGTIYHYYGSEGVYNVTATIFDDNNAATSVTKAVTVTNSTQPSIRVIVDNYSGAAPLAVNFNASMTTDNGETPDDQLHYTWNFRDGSPVQEGVNLNNVSHTFANDGTYYPFVLVRDGENSQIRRFVIVVGGTNTPRPQAIIKRDVGYGDFPLTVNFNAEDSIDATGSSLGLTYEWNFRDHTSAEGSASGKNVTHTFRKPGVYPVRLRVTDSQGNTDDFYENIYVKSPSFNEFRFFSFERDGRNIHFNFEEIYNLTPTTDTFYKIDWGDGQKQISYGRYISHEYATDGTYTVSVEAELASGEVQTYYQDIVVGAQAVGPSFDMNVPMGEGLIPYTASYEITNFNFDPSNSSILWDFGADGIIVDGTNVTKDHSVQGVDTKKTYVTNEFGITAIHYYDINKFVDEKPNLKYKLNSCVGEAPFTVNFDATGSSDADGLKAFQWTTYYNNDEIFFRNLQFSYTFDVAQDLTASAFLKDNAGDIWNDYIRFVIYDGTPPTGNQPPVINTNYGFFDSSKPQRIFLENGGSTDDGSIVCYQVDMGDGNTFTTQDYFYYDYTAAGDYTISITAVDNWGLTSNSTIDITVPEAPPASITRRTSSRERSSVRTSLSRYMRQVYSTPIDRGMYSNEQINELIEEYFNNRSN